MNKFKNWQDHQFKARRVFRVLNLPAWLVLNFSFVSFLSFVPRATAAPHEQPFSVSAPAEILATITVRCAECEWDREGREAVVLTVTVDGRYIQHLPLVRRGRAEYRLLIGAVDAGAHTLRLEEDERLTARDLRGGRHAVVERVDIDPILRSSSQHRAVSLAPLLYARPDTVGRFTDVPVFMWYEVEPTSAGTRYRYSIIFTNEDGGTPADRLMATWGRTTDIEYIYSVEVNRSGAIVGEDMQGPKHEILAFRGRREAQHPLLWVSTENNMVLDSGSTMVRYAPAPVPFPLRDVSREAVMDANPWLYELAAKELVREGKIAADAPPGRGLIPDPRRFVYLEACGELNGAALAFAVRVSGAWIASDRGMSEYRIARDGCFRAAIPLPASIGAADIQGLRAQAYVRPSNSAAAAPSSASAPVRLASARMFVLDQAFHPQRPFVDWRGTRTLTADGAAVEIATPRE